MVGGGSNAVWAANQPSGIAGPRPPCCWRRWRVLIRAALEMAFLPEGSGQLSQGSSLGGVAGMAPNLGGEAVPRGWRSHREDMTSLRSHQRLRGVTGVSPPCLAWWDGQISSRRGDPTKLIFSTAIFVVLEKALKNPIYPRGQCLARATTKEINHKSEWQLPSLR